MAFRGVPTVAGLIASQGEGQPPGDSSLSPELASGRHSGGRKKREDWPPRSFLAWILLAHFPAGVTLSFGVRGVGIQTLLPTSPFMWCFQIKPWGGGRTGATEGSEQPLNGTSSWARGKLASSVRAGLCHFLTVGPWPQVPLSLSLLLCKMGGVWETLYIYSTHRDSSVCPWGKGV